MMDKRIDLAVLKSYSPSKEMRIRKKKSLTSAGIESTPSGFDQLYWRSYEARQTQVLGNSGSNCRNVNFKDAVNAVPLAE